MNTVNIPWQNGAVATKPYHHGALEAALTDAALDVVRTSGVGELSLRELARSVGVSPSATYRHFPSREHLVAHVAQLSREALADALVCARDEVPTTGRPGRRSVERFEAIGRAYVHWAVAQPHLFEAAFTPCDVKPDRADDPSAWDVLVSSIDEMIDAGAIPAHRRADAPLIAWSGVHGLAHILTSSAWPPDTVPIGQIAAVVEGIARAIR